MRDLCITGIGEPVHPDLARDITSSAKNSAGPFARGHRDNRWRPALRRILLPMALASQPPDAGSFPLVGECTAGMSSALGWLENEAEGGTAELAAAATARRRASDSYRAFVERGAPCGTDLPWEHLPALKYAHAPSDPALPNVCYPWAVPVDLVLHDRRRGWPRKLFETRPVNAVAAGYFHRGRYPMLSRSPFELLNELWALWAVHVPIKYAAQMDRAPFWSPDPSRFHRALEAMVDPVTYRMREDCHAPAGLYALAILLALQFVAIRRLIVLLPGENPWATDIRLMFPLPEWLVRRAATRTPTRDLNRILLPLASAYQPGAKFDPMLPPDRPYWGPISKLTFTTARYDLGGFATGHPIPWSHLRRACERKEGNYEALAEARRQAVLAEFRQGGSTASALRRELMKDVRD